MVAKFLHDHLPESFRDRFPLDRLINDLLILLVVILGWLVVDQRGALKDSQDCVRNYLVESSQAQAPRTEANAKKDDALAEAVNSFSPLIHRILENAQHPDPTPSQAQQESDLRLVVTTDKALADFSKAYAELEKARKDFPATPAPENLCKE